ncbi:TonB-dependent receptor plug domain-containing protein [Undibacterium sp. TJN19]|uniref:TonB-dependent receptor plug domain-containing protein n=1 Tax=Undibacterium sp. TJN19 TaxID=3413055 RepID=UPI003BF25635
MKNLPNMKKSVLAIALALAGMQAANAQDNAPPQKVVVTGSNIKRVDSETASPIQILTRQEILESGANTVKDLLDNLSNNDHGAISDLGGANSWASGASGVSLRNLGLTATLTLLNGRRLPSYGFADGLQATFVNIDAIPANAIERVEILKDGASAIYGSDAVAGVINIITRKDYQGVTLDASAQQSLRSSLLNKQQVASITVGTGDFDKDGYNVYAHLEAFHRGAYKDRDIFPLLPDWYLKMNPDRAALSTGSFPGNYTGRYPANYADSSLAGKSFTTAAPGCAPQLLIGGLCRYDYWKDSDANPAADRISFFSMGRKKLGDNLTGFAEISLSNTKSTYYTSVPRSSITGVPLTWYDSLKGEMQYFTDPQLPVGHPNNPYSFPVGLNYRFSDNPDMFKNVGEARQYRVMTGLEGNHLGWEWDSALGTMSSTATQKQHLYRDRYGYYNAIVSGEYKFGAVNPQSVLDKMFPEMGSHGTSTQTFFDFKASRELMALGGGPLQLATGFDIRHETFEQASSDNVLNAQIVQFSGVSIQGSRNVSAAFAELNAPFTKQLEGSFALRADKSGQTEAAVVPKMGLSYKATDFLMLRGTASEGFRAPTLPETGNGGASWFNNGYLDPKRCAMATQMSDALKKGNSIDQSDASVAYNLGCSVSFPARVLPNKDLKPEKSNSFTLGLVLQATKDISLTLDYYNIKRRDEISVLGVDETLANEDKKAGLVERGALTSQDIDLAQRASALAGKQLGFTIGPIATIGAQYANLTKTKVAGFDVDVNSKWQLGSAGKLNAGLELNYQLDYRSWSSFTNSYSENYVGRRGTPKINAIGKFSWALGDWNAGARIYYTSGTTLSWGDLDTANTPQGCMDRGVNVEDCKISADTTVDLSMSYKGWKNTLLSMNLFNAFGRDSLVQMRPGSALPLRGRTLKVSLEHKF